MHFGPFLTHEEAGYRWNTREWDKNKRVGKSRWTKSRLSLTIQHLFPPFNLLVALICSLVA